MGLDVRQTPFADLSDTTLANEDNNSLPSYDSKRAIQAMW